METYFIIFEYDGAKVRKKNLAPLTYEALVKSTSETFNIIDLKFYNAGVEIGKEDLVDFVTKFSSTPDFMLQINACENFNFEQVQDISPITNKCNSYYDFENSEELFNFVKNKCVFVWGYYCQHKFLSNIMRDKLAKFIVNQLLSKDYGRSIRRHEFEKIANNIVEIFPTEIANTYYIAAHPGVAAKGKLYMQYTVLKKCAGTQGLYYRRSKSKSRSLTPTKIDNTSTVSVSSSNSSGEKKLPTLLDLSDDESDLSETNKYLEELKTSIPQTNLNEKWHATYEKRSKILTSNISTYEYIKQFPVLQEAKGYKLFSIDAEIKCKKEIKLNIEDAVFMKLLELTSKSKNPSVISIRKLINCEQDHKYKKILSLLLLAYILNNTPTKSKSSRNLFRPSKIEVQECFIQHCMTLAEADKHERNFIEKSRLNNSCIQPRIILIGVNPIEIAWLLVADFKYVLNDIEEAINASMALFFAANIQYPTQSIKVWNFLQKYFFDIELPKSMSENSDTLALANDLFK